MLIWHTVNGPNLYRIKSYKPMKDITIHISGMSCGHCLNAVSQAIREVPGIEVRSVLIGRAELRVFDGDATARVRAAIENAGYRVEGVIGG